MDRLQTLEIFVCVAECGSFTGAAERLRLPRSTVSAAVQSLEARLQTRLIQRTTRRMQLTGDGVAYFDWCRRLLADIEETEQRLMQGQSRPHGRLRVDVPGRIGRLIIAPALPEFLARYPDIELELGVSDRPVDLVHEGVDCAIRVGTLSDPALIAHPIGPLRVGTFASPAYLARHGTPNTPDELSGHHAVRYAVPVSGPADDWEGLVDGQPVSIALGGSVTVNCAESYIACCIAGLGLIQIPAYDARSHLARGELSEILTAFAPPPLAMTALYPQRRYLSRRVTAFVEWMEALYRQQMAG